MVNDEGDDGYLSDVTLFSELNEGSREGSPDIRSLYATPLHINTATPSSYNTYNQVPAAYPHNNPLPSICVANYHQYQLLIDINSKLILITISFIYYIFDLFIRYLIYLLYI